MYSTGFPFSSHHSSSRHESSAVERHEQADTAPIQPTDTTRELIDAYKKMMVPSLSTSANLPDIFLEEPHLIGSTELKLTTEMMYGTIVNFDRNQYFSKEELDWAADSPIIAPAFHDVANALLNNYQDVANASNDEFGFENDGISGFDIKEVFEGNSKSNLRSRIVDDFNRQTHNRYSNNVLLNSQSIR